MQGLARHSNQHNWLPRGSPEDAAPHTELCASVVAACEVLMCLQTLPEPSAEGTAGIRSSWCAEEQEKMLFIASVNQFLPTLGLHFGCNQSKDGGRRDCPYQVGVL